MPRLSVVIPCHNREHFLPETLASIQAYSGVHSYEVILVDDGSTSEATRAYLQTCSQISNCRVIYQPHAGPAAARNTGVGHAASDYILFLDSDNKIHADLFIDKGIAVLDEHPDAGVFYGNPSFFGDVTDDRVFTTGAFHFDTMLRYNYIDMCSIVRKVTWKEVGGLDENRLLMCYEDWDFWLRIGRTGWKFYYEDAILFEYRITKGSLITQATGAANDKRMVCYIYQKHNDVLPQHLKEWCAAPSPDPFKVSIIVPSYNHAAYLPQRLNSILTQTYQHFELIILDDASPDGSREIIEQYRTHPKVTHIAYNEINSGTTFRQWDKGIRLATGSLIWIAESDDWCEPTFLETVVKGFSDNPQCVLGYTQAYAVNNEGDILWQSSHPKLADQIEGKAYIYQYLGRSNTIFNASMAVFKRDAFYAVSTDYLHYRFSGDWLFWTEIARQGDVFVSGRLLNYFRNHEADVSAQAYASGLNYLEDLQVWAALRKDKLIDEALYKDVLVKKYADFSKAAPFLATQIAGKAEQLFKASGYV